MNGGNGVGYNTSEADNTNHKEVPTELGAESLGCRLALYVSVFLCNAFGVDGCRREGSHLMTMSEAQQEILTEWVKAVA